MGHARLALVFALLGGCVVQTDIHDYPCPCGGGELCSPTHRCDPRGPATIGLAASSVTATTVTLDVGVSGDTSTITRWELRAASVAAGSAPLGCDAAFDLDAAGAATWPSAELAGRTSSLPAVITAAGLPAGQSYCLRLDAAHTTGERSASATIVVAVPAS